MKVVVKVLKILFGIVLIAAVVLTFWFGVFQASAEPEIPIPLPVGLLEPPDLSVTENLYYKNIVDFNGQSIEVPLGFPLYSRDSWDEDGKFLSDSSEIYTNYFFANGGSLDYGLDLFPDEWDGANEEYSQLAKAIYLFNVASYNEKFATNYAYYTEAGGSADIIDIVGKLMSQSIKWSVNDYPDAGNPSKFYSNFFNQQVNALYDANASATVKAIASEILARATRSLAIGDKDYYFDSAFAPTFIEPTSEDLDPTTVPFYEPFLSPANQTVAGGRCSAAWESKTKTVQASTKPREMIDFSKYVGVEKVSDADKEKGYKSFTEVNESKFIVELTTSSFYNEKSFADKESNKPYVKQVWVDQFGNEVAADSPDAVRFYYDCKMVANIEKVNANKGNIDRLIGYTGANPVVFTKLEYQFSVWDTGVFRHWHTLEGWSGTLAIAKGEVQPNNPTYYSYHKGNTYLEDLVRYMVGEERAEAEFGLTYNDGVTYKKGVLVHDTKLEKTNFNRDKYIEKLKQIFG